jgi:hypothetical protein
MNVDQELSPSKVKNARGSAAAGALDGPPCNTGLPSMKATSVEARALTALFCHDLL